MEVRVVWQDEEERWGEVRCLKNTGNNIYNKHYICTYEGDVLMKGNLSMYQGLRLNGIPFMKTRFRDLITLCDKIQLLTFITGKIQMIMKVELKQNTSMSSF